MLIKVGYCDEKTSRFSSCIFAPVWIKTNLQKIQVEPTKHYEKKRNGRERVSLQSVLKHNFSTATILSAGSVEVQYRALHRTYIIVTKNSSTAKKMWQRRNGEDTVCCLEELEAMCFWHSCHSPFEKCIKAIAELVGLGLGTQSRDHHPNLSGEDGRELLLLIVEGLKRATVPLNNKNERPARPW